MPPPGGYLAAPIRGTQPLDGLGTAASVLLAIAGAVALGAAFSLFTRINVVTDYAAENATLSGHQAS